MAIKTYKISKNTKLSEHFKSNQFASDYSSTDSNKYAGILGQEIDAIEIYLK